MLAKQIEVCKNLSDPQLALASLADLQGKVISLITISDNNKELLDLYHLCTASMQDLSDKIERERYDAIMKKFNIESNNSQAKMNANDLSLCMVELNRLLSYVNNTQLRDTIRENLSKISELIDLARKNYNRWALNQIASCYYYFDKNVDTTSKIMRKEEPTYEALDKYLSTIDVNLLTSNVMQMYNEVYSLLSAKLSTKKKIELAEVFERTPKKGLGDV